ncbi:MAG: toprim domain-containing protein [Gemmatimonadaceae bacterium]
MRSFRDFGIDAQDHGTGNYRTVCPQCAPTRKKRHEKSLSVNLDEGVWLCHHCGWAGTLKGGEQARSEPGWWEDRDRPKTYTKPTPKQREESDPANAARRNWATQMLARGITPDVLKANHVDVRRVWFPQIEGDAYALAYPYERRGELVNVKYRHADKHFRMEKDAEQILWRLDQIANPDLETVIIAEGENDALALEVAGFRNATSVPGGAPNPDAKSYDSKFAFLEDEYTAGILASKKRIILATDDDAPGHKLREELTRRLDPARCLTVTWPDGCKDANDVLKNHGAAALAACINRATPVPLEGVISVPQFRDQMDQVYLNGFPPGPSTGWKNLDRDVRGNPLYRPADGLLTFVTGVPGSGKSRWTNALLVNLARQEAKRFGICSPEYQPTELLVKHLAETYVGKSMDRTAADRMSEAEYSDAMEFVGEHFHFIIPETTSIDEILAKTTSLIGRYGIRGLVIDPWTEVELLGGTGVSEVRVLQQTLAMIQRFNRRQGLHVWIVAHPTKLANDDETGQPRVPTMYDINGGAQFANKADFILAVNRDKDADDGITEVYVRKARFQHLGTYGQTSLMFDKITGRYADVPRVSTNAAFAPLGAPKDTWEEVYDDDDDLPGNRV